MRTIVGALAVIVLASAFADAQGGAQTVRVKDEESVCINANDAVSLFVMNFKTTKSKGAFTQDSSVGMNITATINGTNTAKDGTITTQTAKFPVLYETSLKSYADGSVLLPFEYPILNYFQIKQGQYHYRNMQFEMSIFRKKDSAAWGTALELLAQYSKQIALPSSPFRTEFSLYSGLANSAISNGMTNLQNADANNVIPEGSGLVDFDPSPTAKPGDTNCAENRSTGLVVTVESDNGVHSNKNEKGWVDINQTNNYCWQGTLSPSPQVKVAKMDDTGKCAADGWDVLHNDFMLFTLNSITPDTTTTITQTGGGSKGIRVTHQMSDAQKYSISKSIDRCKAFGVAAEKCIPKTVLDAYQKAH